MNNIVVKKFGGTSLTNLNRVAHLIKNDIERGYNVVVVVSAAAGFTDQMALQAQHISSLSCQQELSEYDVLLSAGEQISCGLLAITLQSIGINAKSWLAWQLPIVTDDFYSESKIKEVKIDCLQKSFSEGCSVAIVAGFQGVCNNRLTTFGRGGSDISAVALAVAFNVKTCEIFTDVDGIYTTDPKIVPKARRLKSISYDEMLEMSLSGAKILHNRSIQIAMRHNIKLQVLSTFKESEGTSVLPNNDVLEKHLVTGITYSTNEVLIAFTDLTLHILKDIVGANIRVDMIHNASLVTPKCDVDRAKKLLGKNIDYTINDSIAKISIIGIGITSNTAVMYNIFKVLERNKIEMLAISTSEIKISIIIKKEYAEVLVKDLHDSFVSLS
ncbi:aspartate kinase [Wolbachia endosymbiont of Pentalonia nigronervosa]|uniref:aspartate kinase n=1 Tax=Wolbachia endosymbiont of Pentalonia nigronervosa TaxID=1301914 RepID=UPI00165FD65C|nr:aspartate kinase [Wolbachia endosymbiont of Pentalonia nigronervosa]